MSPTEKSAVQNIQEKVSEAGATVLDLTIESFRLLIQGERILTRVRGSVLPTITAPVVLFAVYSSFFAAIRSTGKFNFNIGKKGKFDDLASKNIPGTQAYCLQ
jgi:hypothetical protein